MPFIHYLFIGHFDRDRAGIRFSCPSPSDPYRPVVLRPIEPKEIRDAIREVAGGTADPDALPDEWSVWFQNGYLVCDKYTRNETEIEFVGKLVERTGCAIYDRGANAEIPLSAWLAATPG